MSDKGWFCCVDCGKRVRSDSSSPPATCKNCGGRLKPLEFPAAGTQVAEANTIPNIKDATGNDAGIVKRTNKPKLKKIIVFGSLLIVCAAFAIAALVGNNNRAKLNGAIGEETSINREDTIEQSTANSGSDPSNTSPETANNNAGSGDENKVVSTHTEEIASEVPAAEPNADVKSSVPPLGTTAAQISIIDVSPASLVEGKQTKIAVTVQYECLEDTECVLMVGVNSTEPDEYEIDTSSRVPVSGRGTYTHEMLVQPVIHGNGVPFTLFAYVDDAYHGDSWVPYATARFELEVAPEAEQETVSIVVPDLIGFSQADATSLIESLGLTFQVWWNDGDIKSGSDLRVVSQSIQEGCSVEKGTLIRLQLKDYSLEQALSIIIDTWEIYYDGFYYSEPEPDQEDVYWVIDYDGKGISGTFHYSRPLTEQEQLNWGHGGTLYDSYGNEIDGYDTGPVFWSDSSGYFAVRFPQDLPKASYTYKLYQVINGQYIEAYIKFST